MSSSRSFTIVVALILGSKFTEGTLQQKFISRPDKPTRVFIGDNVSLVWHYSHPSHFKLYEVVFGIPRSPTGALATKLVAVNGSGFVQVRTGWKSRLQWAGNMTSFLAVFVLLNVQKSDGDRIFGIHVEYDLNTPLTDTVKLQVETRPIVDLPRITYIATPPLLRMGQHVTLYCTASSLSPVVVTWYRGPKALASGSSVAVVTLTNITAQDWGKFLCVANNSVGEDKKSVFLKVLPESPTILSTNKVFHNSNWTLRWSAVYSEGNLLTFYTVWHQVLNVTKDNIIQEKPWSRENVTTSSFMYHKKLAAGTSYKFAVTAWNRWGESLLETNKMLYISTDPDKTTKNTDKSTIIFHTVEPERSVKTSSNRKDNFMETTYVIVYIVLPIVFSVLLVVVVVVALRRKYHRSKKNKRRRQELKGMSPYSFTSQETLTSDHEEAQETPDVRRSVMLAETPITMSESHLNSEQTTSPIRNLQEDCNCSRTGRFFALSTFRHEMNAVSPGPTSSEVTTPSTPSATHGGSERMEQNQDVHNPVNKDPSSKQQEQITEGTNEASLDTSTVYEEAARQRSQGTVNSQALDTFRQETGGTEPDSHSEDYLRPLDNNILQCAATNTGKSQSLTHDHSRPKPKPRFRILGKRETDKFYQEKHSTFPESLSSLHFTDLLKSNALCDTAHIPHARALHEQHGYQNDRIKPTPYQNALRPTGSADSPYARVLSNTNWEVSRHHFSLFEKIGGGSFGQVWKGAALDLAGAKGWSIVAVKMLKENSSYSDLRDLLSELDLLKKLKPHPNVIQLLGCLTREVIRYEDGREFRPPLVILEFVPHGDLLGYLKKSRGETDDYYDLKSPETEDPQKIPEQQLYRFASDIARGMEFISSYQLIHRDLAARNVLVGEGLRCKITDFGMARDLGKNEIYVRRSNGLMPVKWMAVESLTSQVFTTESDVWSYGIVLYEIFTLGESPYKGMTGQQVFNYVESGRRLPKTSAMSSELYDVMLDCWSEDPHKRPAFSLLTTWTETLAQNH